MRVLLRSLISRLVDEKTKKNLKRIEFKTKKRFSQAAPPITEKDFHNIFRDKLRIAEGDLVMVHASASMLNTELQDHEIVDILQGIVTKTGTVIVPTFPPRSSVKFLQKKSPFNAQKTRSGMGSLSEVVRKTPGAIRSTHPIKSVAAIGPMAAEICAGHEHCLYPFGTGSPFEKMLNHKVKIIGIGVTMSYLSFVHVAEDLYHEETTLPIWEPEEFEKTCIDLNGGSHSVRTKAHNMILMQKANPAKFCKRHLDTKYYVNARHWFTNFFVVEGEALTSSIRKKMKLGSSIYD